MSDAVAMFQSTKQLRLVHPRNMDQSRDGEATVVEGQSILIGSIAHANFGLVGAQLCSALSAANSSHD